MKTAEAIITSFQKFLLFNCSDHVLQISEYYCWRKIAEIS